MQDCRAGFTLMELIVIIVILGILSAVAIPSYVNLQDRANETAEERVVTDVRIGLAVSFAQAASTGSPAYPPCLDNAKDGAASGDNPLFTHVLSQGGVTRDWTKLGEDVYLGPNGGTYQYESSTGEFRKDG